MKKQMVPAAPKGAGYTILEVMIFFAVSAFIMLAAMKLIQGKETETFFSQKLRDTQSQLQTWISSSSSGFTGANPATQHCEVSGSPVVKSGGTSNYPPACVYLGKAIQFPPDNAKGSTIYGYSVFGVRLSGGVPPTNMRSSNPAPAVGQGNTISLTDPFSLLPLYVKSVKSKGLDCSVTPCVADNITASHLVGFYGSINSDDNFESQNGGSDVNSYLYKFSGSTTGNDSNAVNCLKMSPSCNLLPSVTYPDKLAELDICLTDGSQYAVITITSNNGFGADVTLQYKICS